jgi:hypothetical protein
VATKVKGQRSLIWAGKDYFLSKVNRLHKGGYTVSYELVRLALGKMAQGAGLGEIT